MNEHMLFILFLLSSALTRNSNQLSIELRNTTEEASRLKRFVQPRSLQSAEIDNVEATFSWARWAGNATRLGSAFVLKKGEKFVEYVVLYNPKDTHFVVRGLLDATGYLGELKLVKNKETLMNPNVTTGLNSFIFKLDTPRIISATEAKSMMEVLSKLKATPINFESVSISIKLPKQNNDIIMEVADLLKPDKKPAKVQIVPNTISVVVNDLPAQTVLKLSTKKPNVQESRSEQDISAIYLFTGSITHIGHPSQTVALTRTSPTTTSSSSATRVNVYNRHPPRLTVKCYVENRAPFQGYPCRGSDVCIPLHWECDGESDCRDGADERSCVNGLSLQSQRMQTGRCKRNEFQCFSKGVDICLPVNWLCDGRTDCSDGFDEDPVNCRNVPPSATWAGSSLNYWFRPSKCGRNYFTCHKGGCVSLRHVCNGEQDCSDGSDEHSCPEDEDLDDEEDSEDYHQVNCDSDHEFLCPGHGHRQCIPRPWVCDDHIDCPDGGDESDDVCSSHIHNFSD